ncbi:unnamed protein product [Adineta steineri]|uniref:Uncharacterized protein n=1 Tax=Adineta steineri TaxID=433720 RepID=A0A815IQZ9_9BILA|nr:unnamed protein product [Adineta steineri]
MARVNEKNIQSLHREFLTVENFIGIWLDANINHRSDDYQSLFTQVQQLIDLIVPFTDPESCMDFISDIKNEKFFLIISGSLGEKMISLLQNFSQINSIYIYCDNKAKHEKWANKEKKIQGVFTKTQAIYDVFRRDIRQCQDDLVSFNMLSSTYNINQSDQLFIYIQILKDILVHMECEPNSKLDFIDFCQSRYQHNPYQLDIIREFKNDYKQSSAIWWYTRECFISSMLNKAFRIHDIDILIKMNFFFQDLHQEIKRLHSKLNKQNHLTIYRGQGITEEELQKILDNSNGFISCNNFLITTTDKNVSLVYACSARDNHGLVGVIFQINIDQSQAIFTPLDKIDYYSESTKEILFTINTIFRIHNIHQIENGLWEIQLTLTTDDDEQLKNIKRLMEKEFEGKNEIEQLHAIMTKMLMPGEFQSEYIETQTAHEHPVHEETEAHHTDMETVQENTRNDGFVSEHPAVASE